MVETEAVYNKIELIMENADDGIKDWDRLHVDLRVHLQTACALMHADIF